MGVIIESPIIVMNALPFKKAPLSILIIILIYLIVTIAVYIFQRKLLYHPYSPPHFSKETSGEGLNYKFDKIKIKVNEKIKLNGWFHFKDKSKK